MTWLDRQGFLGADSDARLDQTTVGLVGLGGGNSHVAQQLAHLGIGRFVLIDDDITTLTNLNRLIGGTYADVEAGTAKVDIARRMILAINPRAHVSIHRAQWQVAAEALKSCDVIVGGLDNIRSKDELDGFCRRFLIPYIDQGMDVHRLGEADGYLVAGQVVLSSPGEPCLRCLGIVTEQALAEEARTYGDAGGKPQVVWPNGILASTAVGLVVQLVTPWTGTRRRSAYFCYDANEGTVIKADRLLRRRDQPCPHYPPAAVGDMAFDIRAVLKSSVRDPDADVSEPEASAAGSAPRRWFASLTNMIRRRIRP
jgi:molybdopterin/thiamine biosynthesis adenylyltransferase